MPIFQKSIIQKHLAHLEQSQLDEAFNKFKHNYSVDKIQQIKTLKEEEYQDGFLRDIFVDVFGYVLKPDDNFNLVREFKNQTDGKKADSAILKENNAIAVIELKSTKTKDLKSITQQAFNYKNNQPHCQYVITSNFQKLRFYIDYANEYEEFDLFHLDKVAFALLYLILNKESLLNGLPLQLKEETKCHEENISAQFYKDYSQFKQEVFANLTKDNPQFDQLLLFKKSQKFLDRLLFVFFAEDTGLVPPNSIATEVENWQKLKELAAYDSLYNRLKKFFQNLNSAYKSSGYEIPAYNGGLFATDKILDKLVIDDEILQNNLLKLAAYDFNTELDVNILGHIFEHSLNELEEIAAKIAGVVTDKGKTKRKKNGIFYTPKYITQYIVENTLGMLCTEKRQELNLVDIEFDESYWRKDTSLSAKGKKLFKALEAYKNWLLTLKILDPACGSGAFLNQALNFLIAEHQEIDNIIADLTNAMPKFYDTDKMILEKNIYGVDINEESVEIARLSLWLRTAKKGRKLSNLSRNIKCGNSLIDDPAVAFDKAFDWNKEFSKIMGKGGFDVVIGNPPYVNGNDLKKNLSEDEYLFLKRNYITAKGTVDLYIYFFERGVNIVNRSGILSYITPNRFLSASYGKALREYLVEKSEIVSLIDYSDKSVFPDASTYPVISFIKHKTRNKYQVLTGRFNESTKQLIGKNCSSEKLNILNDSILGFLLNDKLEITEKVISQGESLENVGKINATSTAKEADIYSSLINKEEGYKLINTGTIDPYIANWGFDDLVDKGNKIKRPYLPENNDLISPKRYKLYHSPKIIISKIGLQCEAFYDKKGEYSSINTNCIHSFNDNYLPEYVLCWLNSKLYNYLFECFFDGLRMSGGYLLYSAPNLRNTYIKAIPFDSQMNFIEKADLMFSLNKEQQEKKTKFLNRITSNLEITKISKKLEAFYNFDFKTFVAELKKQKVTLSLVQEDEWEEYFIAYKTEINQLQTQISTTDKEIDKMVYELYGLTEKEIGIVEESM
ncbi:DNA methyltransferase [Candidatus Parabeggiatoa sp. HSG14]|uniref:Eco57I restriction-modification methylase domain-containing protein n=1 Tax=Candidatus Parabeggiatoa sp. HSG14 TaxID=3055593 RepID=UPI0025A91727|nr:Eco57I restriction-modification methylase domain-containing protein [Thiotrichales bacterium HSG14]